MIQELNVNQLNEALQKAFKVKQTFIEEVTISGFDIRDKTIHIGISRGITIRFTTSRKIKGLPVVNRD